MWEREEVRLSLAISFKVGRVLMRRITHDFQLGNQYRDYVEKWENRYS